MNRVLRSASHESYLLRGESATGAAARRHHALAGPIAQPPRPPKPRRFYVISNGDDSKRGIWHANWVDLCATVLPGGQLFGSGLRVKGFDNLESAEAHWRTKHTSRAPLNFLSCSWCTNGDTCTKCVTHVMEWLTIERSFGDFMENNMAAKHGKKLSPNIR